MQRTVAVPRPREPADGGRAAPAAADGAGPVPRLPPGRAAALRLAAAISADGRAHPSTAVRRHNWTIRDGQDPFIRHYFGVLAAFRLGAARARRAAMADEPAESFEARFGRLVKAAREAAGITQSTLERNAGLIPTTVTRVERGDIHGTPAIAEHRPRPRWPRSRRLAHQPLRHLRGTPVGRSHRGPGLVEHLPPPLVELHAGRLQLVGHPGAPAVFIERELHPTSSAASGPASTASRYAVSHAEQKPLPRTCPQPTYAGSRFFMIAASFWSPLDASTSAVGG